MRDLSELEAELSTMRQQLNWLLSGAQLENSSIDRGGLQIRAEEGVIIGEEGSTTGSGRVYGTLYIDGRLVVDGEVVFSGQMVVNGPWELNGDGDITGTVHVTGDINVDATGKITVGGMVLDPSNHDGMITLPNDSQILAFENNLELYGPLGPNGRPGVLIKPDGVHLAGLPTATSTTGLSWIAIDITGQLWKVPPNIGGPTGGPLAWPFPASSVTSEYGPRDGGFHYGIDFGQPEGAPIPACDAGTVVESVTLHPGWGNYVKIDHGGGLETLYAHMVDPPPVSVGDPISRNQIIGNVGDTGESEGNHLHLEVHVNGSPVNPRSKLETP